VKLLDFGISKLAPQAGAPDQGMTSTQTLMGSPLYMSPEQLRSTKNVDRRADLWSMGIILYEMLGGRSPFEADTLPEVCARIMAEPPPGLSIGNAAAEAVVMRCLEKDPNHRYADAGALAMALAPLGGPESRAIADRIARVVRSSDASLPGLRVEASGSQAPIATVAPVAAAAASGIVQTSAQFGTVSSAKTSRRSAVPVAVAGVALAIAIVAIGIGVTRMRSKPAQTAPIVATPATPSTGSVAPALQPTPVMSAIAAPAASAAGMDPAASAVATAAPTPVVTNAPARPPPKPKPAATGNAPAPAATTPKPASTNGFGGRD
jgi:serine/threonine-protein kinase